MSAHEILIAVMAGFAVLGAVDRIFGNRFGIGQEFENGILAMGSLAMAMLGIISLAPVLAAVLKPVIVPVFGLLGADPAMFAGSILACDMGGGSLAAEMTTDPQAALLGGVFLRLCLSILVLNMKKIRLKKLQKRLRSLVKLENLMVLQLKLQRKACC